MKMTHSDPMPRLFGAVLVLFPLSPCLAADAPAATPSIEHVGRQVRDAAKAVGDYSTQKGSEVAGTVKSGFDDLKTQTQEQWEEVDRTSREKSKEALDEASTHADRLKSGSQNAWEHVRKGFSDAFSSFRQAWEQDDTRDASKK